MMGQDSKRNLIASLISAPATGSMLMAAHQLISTQTLPHKRYHDSKMLLKERSQLIIPVHMISNVTFPHHPHIEENQDLPPSVLLQIRILLQLSPRTHPSMVHLPISLDHYSIPQSAGGFHSLSQAHSPPLELEITYHSASPPQQANHDTP